MDGTGRDILAAATLVVPQTKPGEVLEFVKDKLASNKSLRAWGGMLTCVYEEFGLWQSEKKRLAAAACPFCGCGEVNSLGLCARCCQSREVAAGRAEDRQPRQDMSATERAHTGSSPKDVNHLREHPVTVSKDDLVQERRPVVHRAGAPPGGNAGRLEDLSPEEYEQLIRDKRANQGERRGQMQSVSTILKEMGYGR
jgi:hypothetical protein